MKDATRGLQDRKRGRVGGLEGKLRGDYLRLLPGLCLEDRTNSQANSRLVLGGRFWSIHTFQRN